MQKQKFTISGMNSVSTATQIKNILKKQSGVEIVKANPQSGKLVIVFNENKTKNLNFKQLISSLGNFKVEGADKTEKAQETETKAVKKSSNLQNENNLFGLYYGNTFIVGVFIGIGFMSLLLNIILLSILFENF